MRGGIGIQPMARSSRAGGGSFEERPPLVLEEKGALFTVWDFRIWKSVTQSHQDVCSEEFLKGWL